MKKHFFQKYIFAFLGILFSCFLAFTAFFGFFFQRLTEKKLTEQLDQTAREISQCIVTMTELSDQDFLSLVQKEKELLSATLLSQKSESELEIMITDESGKILVSTMENIGKVFPAGAMQESEAHAEKGEVFRSDLQGFFSSRKYIRVLLLEKEVSAASTRRVGTVFLTLPVGLAAVDRIPVVFFLAGCILLFAVLAICFYLIMGRIDPPMRELNRAAEAFAKEDFSVRLSEEHGGDATPLLRAFNQMAEKMEKNEEIRQTFISNVSHDLRTPLTTIGGFVQNMLSGAIGPERQAHYFQIILSEVERLSRLVQTLLETSRMTAGERKYSFCAMDLCELARLTLLSFEKRLEEKKIEVSVDFVKDSLHVHADPDAIQQVIYNLLDNAIKFTPEKGEISLVITSQGQKAFLSVKNSGSGIPRQELSHLFDRVYKSDRSRGLDKRGMGLGLFIVKSIISAHKEEVWVESAVGEYTEFIFSLPLTAASSRRQG